MWKIYTNALSTNDNLFRRKCSPTLNYLICQDKAETMKHKIFECWTRRVWFFPYIGSITPPPATHTIIQWLTFLLSLAESYKENLNIFLHLCLWVCLFRKRRLSLILIRLPLILFLLSNLALKISLNFYHCSKTNTRNLKTLSTILHYGGSLPLQPC